MSRQEIMGASAVERAPLYARSVARRATVTLGLIIGFYVLTVALIIGLFIGTFALILFFSVGGLIPAVFTLTTAIVLLAAVLPKRKRFKAPGPRITATEQPKLFQAIAEVAKQAEQQVPEEVYLIPQVNAWVSTRGGILGIGKRKVLSIGLPLIGTLSAAEFRAVLAHEFGHYYGGDTRFSPAIYKAHNSMLDVANGLSNSGYSAWMNIVMLPYVDIFLHITLGISRYQEYAADRLAARITSVSATSAALRMVHATDDIFDAYWHSNIKPLLDAGFIPPITEGINRFMSSNLLSSAIKRKAEQKVEDSKVKRFAEYSTHPRLAQRIEALADISDALFINKDSEARAASLVGDISQLEREIFAKYIGEAKVDGLKPVAWENICTEVYFPTWRQTVRRYSAGLADVTPEMLPDIARNMSTFSVALIEKSEKQIDSNRGVGQAKSASATIGAAITLALHNAGWAVNAEPGQPTAARRGGEEIRPFEILGRLVSGNLSGEEWCQCCHNAGIAGVNFGNLLSQSKAISATQ